MRVWRISRARFAESALSGEGARLFAGRWNHQGTPLVYTSTSLALAAMELFVHLEPEVAPDDLVSVAIEIPDGLTQEEIDPASLPSDWRRTDHPSLREIGSRWAIERRSLSLRVPSAAVDGEWNLLLNPHHSEFPLVRVIGTKAFHYDARMFR